MLTKEEKWLAEQTIFNLKNSRAAYQVSQAALARLLGVSVQTVIRWEKGKALPGRAMLGLLMGISLGEGGTSSGGVCEIALRCFRTLKDHTYFASHIDGCPTCEKFIIAHYLRILAKRRGC